MKNLPVHGKFKTKIFDELPEEDRKYYQKELKSFQKFRKYHDTYVVGVDENGRTFIVHVSNKKDRKQTGSLPVCFLCPLPPNPPKPTPPTQFAI